MTGKSNRPEADIFCGDLIRHYVESPYFINRKWLSNKVETYLNNIEHRFLLLTAEPGAGKTAFIAGLANQHPQWMRYFIRRDSQTPLSSGDARTFLLTIGHQLASIFPTLFHPDKLDVVVKQDIGRIAPSGRVLGITVDDLKVSPFYKTALRVEQKVQEVAGELEGLSIKEMVAEPRLLELGNPARFHRRISHFYLGHKGAWQEMKLKGIGDTSLKNQVDSQWGGCDVYGLRNLPFHLSAGALWPKLRDVLTDFSFMEAKVAALSVYDLQIDYRIALKSWLGKNEDRAVLKAFEETLSFQAHHINRARELLFPQLYNHLVHLG